MQIDDGITPNVYFDIMNALTMYSTDDGFREDIYIFNNIFSAIFGFPNTDKCRSDTSKAMCFIGAPVKDVDDTDTVRLPCSYCQSLFSKSESCGGILSNFTNTEMLAKVDGLQNDTLVMVKNTMIILQREDGWKNNITTEESNLWNDAYTLDDIRKALRLAIKTLYEGCTASTCNVCGNSFYVFSIGC